MSDRDLFVLHHPRSGSTLLQVMLTSHPSISVAPESRAFVKLIRHLPVTRPLEASEVARAQRFITEDTKLNAWNIDLGDYFSRVAEYQPGITVREMLHDMLAVYRRAVSPGATIIGIKREPLIELTDELSTLFPGCQFIYTYRDPRAASASALKHLEKVHSLEEASLKWWWWMRRGSKHRRTYQGRWFDVCYEELVTTPEKVARAICAYLGVDYSDTMLRHHEFNANFELVASGYEDMHTHTMQPISATHIDKWRQELSHEDIATVEAIAGPQMRQRGYMPEGSISFAKHLKAAWMRYKYRRSWQTRNFRTANA
ncbi:MAG: sulfotransferase [Anaerolineae bacterium]